MRRTMDVLAIQPEEVTETKRFADIETRQVATMHRKFGLLVSTLPTRLTTRKLQERVACLCEELNEFKTAVDDKDLEGMADALVDLVVFAKGTAVMMGLPWAILFDDVMRANMAKVRGVGHRGHKVDLVKPHGWSPPRGDEILMEHGYDQDAPEVDDE